MKIKTSDIIGAQLDWAVERSLGTPWINGYFSYPKDDPNFSYPYTSKTRPYSTEWAQGGPIIEREKIGVTVDHSGVWIACSEWNYQDEKLHMHSGPTPLIAAMRCYVASKMGNEVEIPDELA